MVLLVKGETKLSRCSSSISLNKNQTLVYDLIAEENTLTGANVAVGAVERRQQVFENSR